MINGSGISKGIGIGIAKVISSQSGDMSSEEFAEELLKEEKVAIVPGTAFGDSGEGYLRISYAYSIENLREALGRLSKFVKKLREKNSGKK